MSFRRRPHGSWAALCILVLLSLTWLGCGGGSGGSGPVTPPPTTPTGPKFNTTEVAVSAVKMVYDPSRNRIYASVNSTDSAHANTVAVVDVAASSLITTIPVGNSPRAVRLSDDYKYLYVGVDGTGEVKTIDLGTNSIVKSFPVAPTGVFGKVMAGDIAVMPGKPDTVAVAWRYEGIANNGGVAIYDSGVQRPSTSHPGLIGGPDIITFGNTAETIYAANNSVSNFALLRMTVNSDGVAVKDSKSSMFGFAYYFEMLFDSGRLYSSTGAVADADAMSLVGSFDAGGSIAVNSATKSAWMLSPIPRSGTDKNTVTLSQFDTDTFLLKGTQQAEVPSDVNFADGLLQCGSENLAFIVSRSGSTVTSSIRLIKAAPTASPITVPTLDTLQAKHIVYDALRRRIYASVPRKAGAKGNSIAVINPASKTIESFLPIGSDPNVLVLSPDARYLYIGLDGAASIARLDLNSLTVDLRFSIAFPNPQYWLEAPLGVKSIAVSPLDSRIAIVAARFLDGRSPDYAAMGVFEDGVARANYTTNWVGNWLAFDQAGTTLYASDDFDALWHFSIDGGGLSYLKQFSAISRSHPRAYFSSGGDLYSFGGRRVDPVTPHLKGMYPVPNSRGITVNGGTTYVLGDLGTTTAVFEFDRDKYIPKGYQKTSIPAGNGFDFVSCGPACFALATTNSGVVILGDSFTTYPSVGSNAANLPATRLLYDKAKNLIYASVPSRAGDIGNSISIIDPTTQTIISTIFVGSEPGPLALSRDGSLLYVGLDGEARCVVVDLVSHNVSGGFDIPFLSSEGHHFVDDMAVKPDDPNVVAVLLRRDFGWSPKYAGLRIYDHESVLPGELPPTSLDIGTIAFGDSSSEFYGYNNWDTGFDYFKFNLDSSGVTVKNSYRSFIYGFGATLSYYNGLLYSSNGYSIDPATDSLAGRFPGAHLAVSLANDDQNSYFLHWDVSATPRASVAVYNRNAFARLGSFGLPQVTARPHDLIRFGSTGLVLATSDDRIVFTNVPQITPPDVPLSKLPANHMVYDPLRKRIYAAVPGSAPARGNTITVIDPSTARIEQSIPVGSEPYSLALSSDAKFLYVGLLGANAVKRVNLVTKTVDESISTGWDQLSGTKFARSLSVSPSDSNVVAISKASPNFVPAFAGASLYNGTTELPSKIEDRVGHPDAVIFSSSSSTLYGLDLDSTEHSFYVMSADSTGLHMTDSARNWNRLGTPLLSEGLIYTSTGVVIDPNTKSTKTTFALTNVGDAVTMDVASRRVVFLEHNWDTKKVTVEAFDTSTGALAASQEITSATTFGTDIVCWGQNQYAVSTGNGIFLLNGTLR
jgi:YVTN family beta-propeller protein